MRAHRTGRALAAFVLVGSFLALGAPRSLAQPPDDCLGQTTNDGRSTDGDDFLTGSEGDDIAALGLGSDQYYAFDGADVICGNEGEDVLAGEAGGDTLNGGVGDDIVIGMTGQDSVAGFGGNDVLSGGNGDDVVRALTLDDAQDDLYDGTGSDVILGNSEDVWHQCSDGEPDDHDGFNGTTVPDTDC